MIYGPIVLTGAGGDIGIALARVLKEAVPNAILHGADCNGQAVGAEFVDQFHILPRADDAGFLPALEELVRRTGAQAIIPLAEAELKRLAQAGLLQKQLAGAHLITANASSVEIGLDKLATAYHLAKSGIAVPQSGIVGQDEPGDFDLIIKPRSGQGSKGLLRTARADFASHRGARAGQLWQRWLRNENAEFTCGVARFPTMATRSICFRRSLHGGLTGRGEVVDDAALNAVCAKVAEALDLNGAINIQLRMDDGVPMIFEINPRFSSTVGFRHRLGFCDAMWFLQHRLGLSITPYDPPLVGTRIERVAQEVIRPPLTD